MHPLLAVLKHRAWRVAVVEGEPYDMPAFLSGRYPGLPSEVWALLGTVRECVRVDEASWLLGAPDYDHRTLPFRWNEYEVMATEAARSSQERSRIASFWNLHFPFWLSVSSDYDYLAVRLDDGAVVHGFAPEWESPTLVAPSFQECVERMATECATADAGYPWSVFV